MKALIWVIIMGLGLLLDVRVGLLVGYVAVGSLLIVPEFFFAWYLCEKWDDRSYRKDAEYPITAEHFHTLAVENNFSAELQVFKTKADWELIFNDEVNAAIQSIL